MNHKRLTGMLALSAAALLAFTGPALAASPTQADFDACNAEAQAKQSPAASPSGASGGVQAGGSSSMPSGSGAAGGGSSVSGSTKSDSGTSASGSTGTSGSTSGGTSIGATGTAPGGEKLQGIAAAGASDPAYQQAYRDCMKGRGF